MDPVAKQDAVRRLMEELGCTEDDALYILAHQDGPNQGDIKSDPPLTEEEWRALGLGVVATPTAKTLKEIGGLP